MSGSVRRPSAGAWVLLLGCSTAPQTAPSAPPPGPVPPPHTELAAPASSDRGCEVAVRARVVPLGQGRYELIARAGNETERLLEAELLYECPGTPARFDGLPPAYDLGNLCQAGACPGGNVSRQKLVLPPGGSSELARVVLDGAAGPCNAELPAGSYSIGASVRLQGAQSCSTSRGTFEHARSAPPAAPRARRLSARRRLPRRRRPARPWPAGTRPVRPG